MTVSESYQLAGMGKKGNLICEFEVGDNTVYELRECPKNDKIYMVWWEWTTFDFAGGIIPDWKNFVSYTKKEVEENFLDGSWKVVGNKCKRAIFK